MDTTVDVAPGVTFVRMAEVWVPEDGRLVHAGGDYADAPAFAEASADVRFAKGEGLPGRAWELERPIVLKSLEEPWFRRTEAAAEAGLTCAIALPIFAERTLRAVLVVLCGTDAEHNGAIELWEETDEGRLGLVDGYYGTAAGFEAASHDIDFAPGQGLPGAVWAGDVPILMRDIARSSAFLRRGHAAAAGFRTGLGLPVPTPSGRAHVLTLLSAPNTPIARRFEIWDARPERVGPGREAQLIDGLCERDGPLWPHQNPPVDPPMAHVWKGPVGQVLGTGLPHVQRDGTGLPGGYAAMVAVPVYHESDLAYVVAWYV